MPSISLSGRQFRALAQRLRLTNHDLTLFTGAATSTIFAWGTRARIPQPISTLMLLFHAQPELIRTARALLVGNADFMLPASVLEADAKLAAIQALEASPAGELEYKPLAHYQTQPAGLPAKAQAGSGAKPEDWSGMELPLGKEIFD